jgi:hypothetical protein
MFLCLGDNSIGLCMCVCLYMYMLSRHQNQSECGCILCVRGCMYIWTSLFVTVPCCDSESIPDDIRYLPQLRQLVLFGNKLTSLPSAMRKLWALEVLTVSQNSLRTFPKELALDLTNLRCVWCTNVLPCSVRENTKIIVWCESFCVTP